MKTKYPDHELIERLARKYLAHSIRALTPSEQTDLINHLREDYREHQELKEAVTAALIHLPQGNDGKRLLEDALGVKNGTDG